MKNTESKQKELDPKTIPIASTIKSYLIRKILQMSQNKMGVWDQITKKARF